jgi:Phage phiEco32-like COOH.NH2 ligase-type 2
MRIGSDPETFLVDTSGKPISAIGYIKADKWNPMQIPDMPEGYTLQEDNVSLEYGIPPASTSEELVRSINAVMNKSLEYLPGLSFSKLSCIIFPEDQMQHPLAHIFGCEPDFDAWTLKDNKKPNPPHPFMRSAGGHIHIETKKDPVDVVRNCDLILGVASVLMDNGEDRKKLYGKAGAHRIKPYGVEYRTLSNFWIFEDRLIDWVFRNTSRAEQLSGTWDVSVYAESIIEAINNNNKQVAKELVDEFNLEVI